VNRLGAEPARRFTTRERADLAREHRGAKSIDPSRRPRPRPRVASSRRRERRAYPPLSDISRSTSSRVSPAVRARRNDDDHDDDDGARARARRTSRRDAVPVYVLHTLKCYMYTILWTPKYTYHSALSYRVLYYQSYLVHRVS
jgi:hypothetical protein